MKIVGFTPPNISISVDVYADLMAFAKSAKKNFLFVCEMIRTNSAITITDFMIPKQTAQQYTLAAKEEEIKPYTVDVVCDDVAYHNCCIISCEQVARGNSGVNTVKISKLLSYIDSPKWCIIGELNVGATSNNTMLVLHYVEVNNIGGTVIVTYKSPSDSVVCADKDYKFFYPNVTERSDIEKLLNEKLVVSKTFSYDNYGDKYIDKYGRSNYGLQTFNSYGYYEGAQTNAYYGVGTATKEFVPSELNEKDPPVDSIV